MSIRVLTADALPLCEDDKENEDSSEAKLQAFVEVEVIKKTFLNFLKIVQDS